jgi:AcrR family transcriptional regulator
MRVRETDAVVSDGSSAKKPEDREVRQRILDEASAVFAEAGYEGAKVQEIARRVGISAPAMYWHFENKSDIFASVLEEDYRTFQERIDAGVTSDDPAEKLYQIICSHVRSQINGRDPSSPSATTFTISQLTRHLPEDRQSKIRSQQRDYLRLVESVLEEGLAAGSFEIDNVTVTAFSLVNLAEYVITWYRPSGQLGVDEVAHLHGMLALRMVQTHLPGLDDLGTDPSQP